VTPGADRAASGAGTGVGGEAVPTGADGTGDEGTGDEAIDDDALDDAAIAGEGTGDGATGGTEEGVALVPRALRWAGCKAMTKRLPPAEVMGDSARTSPPMALTNSSTMASPSPELTFRSAGRRDW
jgi:hypothetical protein